MTVLLIQVVSAFLMGGLLGIRLLPLSGPGRHSLALGLGGLFALLFIGGLMWLMLVALNMISPWVPLLGLAFVVLAVELLARAGAVRLQPWAGTAVSPDERLSRTQWAVVVVLVVLIAGRLLSLLPDVLMRPLFAWDAWTVWGYEARVWLETGGYVAFLPRTEWLSAPPESFIRDGLLDYPKLVPALILWASAGSETWTGVGPGLIWWLGAGLIALIIYGSLRQAGLGLPWAWAGVYAFVSLPMVSAHVALYGYADLWIAAALAAFSALLLLAERSARPAIYALAWLSLLPLPLIKEEGLYWLLCGSVAVLATRIGLTIRRLAVLLVFGVLLATIASSAGFDMAEWITRGRLSFSLELMLSALSGAARHAFVWHDWHLFGYICLFAMVVVLLKPGLIQGAHCLAALSLLGLALIWIAAPMSGAGFFVTIGTLFSRLLLQLAPALVLFCILVFHGLLSKKPGHESSLRCQSIKVVSRESDA